MARNATTVRVVTDIRTYDPEDLQKVIKTQGDSIGDHMVSVVLPSMGFEGKAQAGGTFVHEHDAGDRECGSLHGMPRLFRDDGQDEI
jgi:hypothetical protein